MRFYGSRVNVYCALTEKLPNATVVIRQHGVELMRRDSTIKIERYQGEKIITPVAKPFDYEYWTKRT